MKYQNILTNSKVQCLICPRKCVLAPTQSGFCHVRKNVKGNIELTTYGYNTGLAIDPIEKKPLYHFYPGSFALSFGTLGCNMGCQFCQNWQTTKNNSNPQDFNKTSPKEIVEIAQKYNCKSVAFTYNDPIIFFEYAIDCAKLCRENGIKTVAITSGYINPEPAKEFFKYMDGANIDLKGFSKEFYKKNCLSDIEPVLKTIEYTVNKTNCHTELTTMLIEGENDGEEMLKSECEWILKNLNSDIPLHFSAFFPRYKFSNKKATSFSTLLKAYKIAKQVGLNNVYTGNLTNIETSSTYCKNCARPLIVRDGYQISEYNLVINRCKFCGSECCGQFV